MGPQNRQWIINYSLWEPIEDNGVTKMCSGVLISFSLSSFDVNLLYQGKVKGSEVIALVGPNYKGISQIAFPCTLKEEARQG